MNNKLINADMFLIVVGLFCSTAATQNINTSQFFPDENFRRHIEERMEVEHDGVFTPERAKSFTSLSPRNRNIESIQGIEFFTELQTLDIYRNKISSLDLSRNLKLLELSCSNNNLTEIILPEPSQLQKIGFSDNRIENLDFLTSAKNTLISLYCSENQIKNIKIEFTNLTTLSCHRNNLERLEFVYAPSLHLLMTDYNNLKSIDLSYVPLLESINIDQNDLDNIDVSNNHLLRRLNIAYNNLDEIDVSKNPMLDYLDISHNNLTDIDLSENPVIAEVDCSYNRFSDLKGFIHIPFLRYLDIRYCQMTDIDADDIRIIEDRVADLKPNDYRGSPRWKFLYSPQSDITTVREWEIY